MSKHDVVTTLRKSYEHLVRFIGQDYLAFQC